MDGDGIVRGEAGVAGVYEVASEHGTDFALDGVGVDGLHVQVGVVAPGEGALHQADESGVSARNVKKALIADEVEAVCGSGYAPVCAVSSLGAAVDANRKSFHGQ